MNQQIELLFWNLDQLVGEIFKHSDSILILPLLLQKRERENTSPALTVGLEIP